MLRLVSASIGQVQRKNYEFWCSLPLRNLRSFSISSSASSFHSGSNEKNSNKKSRFLTFGSYGVGVAVLYGIFGFYRERQLDKANPLFNKKYSPFLLCAASISEKQNISGIDSPRIAFNFIADVVQSTQNSVVCIEIYARHPLTKRKIFVSNGSGFIIQENGLILTNAHVVNHYGQVMVKLYDGREFSGIVENIDTESDLATVRIQAKNLPVLPLGNSSSVRPGEFVIAMGNPLLLNHTVTHGVVSSTNRQGKVLGLHEKADYIQTDAAVNVGNSGGPLVNLDGHAIGINTLKMTEGISFAIPSDSAVEFLKRSEGKTRSGYSRTAGNKHKFLGISMMTLSPAVIKHLKESDPDFPSVEHGVLVWRVMVGSPSFEYGIRPGDVITSVNEHEVHDADDIQQCMEKEDTLSFLIHRGRSNFKVSVPLMETVMP